MRKISDIKSVAHGAAIEEATKDQNKMVMAKVPQGYETNINIRLVPAREFDLTVNPWGCRSRKETPRPPSNALGLPESLIEKLEDGNETVIGWLAEDEANAQMFMAQPAEALVRAGVKLTRAEQKNIKAVHDEVKQIAVVGPGVKVESLNIQTFPKGEIGKIKPGEKPQDKPNNIGCAKE